MATRFSDLPTEIWLVIAHYLPKSQLFELKSLNSFFLSCWLTIRWKEITINTLFPDRTVDLLMRVLDPFVVTRTKTLNICLKATKSISFDDAHSVLLQSLPLLPAVTSLKIELHKSAASHFTTLFRTIACSPSFSRTLQSLLLSATVEMLQLLAEHTAHYLPFQNLTHLALGLIDLRLLDPFSSHTEIPVTSNEVAPFLLFLAPTLQSLRITTSFDLSPLFDALTQPSPSPTFPNLKSLFLIFLPSPSTQSTPQFLRRFLVTHNNTLQHLHLRLEMNRIRPTTLDTPLDAWLAELVNINSPFPSLQTLDIYPLYTQSSLFALLTLLKRTAPTLSSLSISSRYLTADEARQVLDALTERGHGTQVRIKQEQGKLKSLCMDITHLSVPFLDLLSRKLPHLEKLALRVSEVVGSDQVSFFFFYPPLGFGLQYASSFYMTKLKT